MSRSSAIEPGEGASHGANLDQKITAGRRADADCRDTLSGAACDPWRNTEDPADAVSGAQSSPPASIRFPLACWDRYEDMELIGEGGWAPCTRRGTLA